MSLFHNKILLFALGKWKQLLLLVYVISFAACSQLTHAKQVTANMSPTIKINDTVVFEGISYKLGEVERGDIVSMKSPDERLLEGGNGQEYIYIFRVVGLGGDKIKISNGRVYVNSALFEAIPENKTPDPEFPVKDFGEITVPQNEYFMLGDNLGRSFDSRFWKHSTITRDKILFKAWTVKDGTTGETRNL